MRHDREPAADRSILGFCPECGVTIPAGGLLIAYESDGGWPRMFAECPDCATVVHPE